MPHRYMNNNGNSLKDFLPYYNHHTFHLTYIFRKYEKRHDLHLSFIGLKRKLQWFLAPKANYLAVIKSLFIDIKCLLFGHNILYGRILCEKEVCAGDIIFYGSCQRCEIHAQPIMIPDRDLLDYCVNKEEIIENRSIIFRRIDHENCKYTKGRRLLYYRKLARDRKEYKMADIFRQHIVQLDFNVQDSKNGSSVLSCILKPIEVCKQHNISHILTIDI